MRVAVVGATGAVGTLLLTLLERRGFPADEVVAFASARLAGKRIGEMVVQPLADDTIGGFDVALFSAGGATSRDWAPSSPRPARWWSTTRRRFRMEPTSRWWSRGQPRRAWAPSQAASSPTPTARRWP